MRAGLSPRSAAVIVSVTEAVWELYEETVDLTLYRWDGCEVHVAAADSKIDPAVTLLFTLGSLMGSTVFVAPTDGEPKELGSALAQVEAHFAKRRWNAHYGHFSSMDHPYLAERGRVGLVTASPMGLTACKGLPERLVAGATSYDVVALIWLEGSELALAREEGVESLQRQWLDEGRDLIGI